jgi:hypothetical protein
LERGGGIRASAPYQDRSNPSKPRRHLQRSGDHAPRARST